MSRARILADYVSSGDELALKAPIAGPTFTGTVGGLGTPVINLGSATGAIPVGVTGGSGLNAVNPTNLAAGLFGAIERTSLTSPDTITATCTLADTLGSAGSISADLFGSSSVTLFGGVSQTNAAITFDYGASVTKYLRYIEWYQVDGAGNSTGIKIRGSDNGTSWTDITTITSAIVNGTTYSYTNYGTTGYRYWQVQYTWSSANRGNVQDFIIHESDSSTLTTLSPATSFPAGHVIQVDGFSDTTEHQDGATDWENKITAELVITPKIATSNMFLTATFTGYNTNSSGTWHADFYKSNSTATTYNLSTKTNGLASQQGDAWAMATIQWLDLRSENDTNAITYTISFRASNYMASIGGNTNYVTTLYAFEIMA